MANSDARATLKYCRPRTSQCPVLLSTALATHRDHLNRGLVGCMPSADDVCVREEKKGREGEADDRQLGLAVSCHSIPIMTPLVSKPRSLWFLQLSACLRYCFGGQLTERLQRKSLERKQKWSKGPFPTLFLAPVCLRRLKRTLPKQRDCLCRCPNSQPTHVCTLAHRQRRTHSLGRKKMFF